MKNFVLVWLYGGKPHPIRSGDIKILQYEKKRLKTMPQFKKGVLLIRTHEGLLNNPSFAGRTKQKTEKVDPLLPEVIKETPKVNLQKSLF